MTWDDYYERFYDLSLSTQKSYSYKLTSYGDAEEVFEVLSVFAFYDKQFATRFASKAVDAGVHFSPDHVLEMALLVDKPVLSRMAETVVPAFDAEQLEEIYMLIDDASFARISKRQNIDIFSDEEPGEELAESKPEDDVDFVAPPQKKPGFFSTLFAIAAGISLAVVQKKSATIGDAMVTVQTVHRIMATAMAAGIMVIIMCTAVSLKAIEAAAEWTKERRRCLEKRKKFLCLPMM